MQAKLKEIEEALESLQAKYSALDKTKARIAAELEDLNLDVEKVNLAQTYKNLVHHGTHMFLGSQPRR